MGGRGATSGMSSGRMVHTTAGSYPQSMENLVGANGHISLKAEDYADYTEEEVAAFLASRGYESLVLFDPEGKVALITSDFEPNVVHNSPKTFMNAIEANGSDTGDGYRDFHVHPLVADDDLSVFSPEDIGLYVSMADVRDSPSFRRLPDTYSVRAADGSRYELKHVGGGSKATWDFPDDYEMQLIKLNAEAKALFGDGPTEVKTSYVNAAANQWLKQHSSDYGFEYTSNL